MRIAILTHSYPATSSEREYAANSLFSFTHILADKVEKVFVLAPDYGGKKEKYRQVPVFWLPLAGNKKRFGHLRPWSPKDVFQLLVFLVNGRKLINAFIRENKIDFCLVVWTFPSGLFAFLAKRKLGTPYGVWAWGTDIYTYPRYPILRQIIKKILQEADIRFGHGKYMSKKVEELSGKFCYFLPALTTLSFDKQKKPKLDPKKFNLFYLGRLEKIKGVELLLDAIIELSKETMDFNFYFIGDGTLKEPLKKRVTQSGLENSVFFLGRIDEKKSLAGYYLNTDVIVIPSRVECLPMAFTEAVRAGLPMIAGNIGDMGRLIKKYNLGLVFAKEDKQSLIKALRKAFQEGKSFKPNHQRDMKKVASQFTVEAAVDQFMERLKKKGYFCSRIGRNFDHEVNKNELAEGKA